MTEKNQTDENYVEATPRTVFMQPNIRTILSEAISMDIGNYEQGDLVHISALMSAFVKSGQYMFFTYDQIAVIKDAMANHVGFRRFVLNLFESTGLLVLAVDGDHGDWVKGYIDRIVYARGGYENSKTSILLSMLVETLKISLPDLDAMLNNNRWLVTLYLAVFYGAWEAAFRSHVER